MSGGRESGRDDNESRRVKNNEFLKKSNLRVISKGPGVSKWLLATYLVPKGSFPIIENDFMT